MILEIGGGSNPRFHPNMDVRNEPGVDIVADLNKKFPLGDETYDEVYSSFCIEHISWQALPLFLTEVKRVLKPGGKATFITANLLEQCRKAVQTETWDQTIPGMIFGGQDYPENTHRCGFSPGYAIRLFREAGFDGVAVCPLPRCNTDMIIEARK